MNEVLSDLTKQIDLIAAAIQAATRKPVLVIIDDLDKLDLPVVKSIFQDNINALFSPKIRVLFTVPIAVMRDPQILATLSSRSRIVMLPVTKFFTRETVRQPDAAPIEANIAMLQQVLKKRIPDHLIEPDSVRKIVLLSGGA